MVSELRVRLAAHRIPLLILLLIYFRLLPGLVIVIVARLVDLLLALAERVQL